MNPKDIFLKENIYFGEAVLAGVSCSVGYIKKFKWSWLATQLNIFVFIGKTELPVTRDLIDGFSTACFNYAKANNKGWPRGIQSAVGSIAILQANSVHDDAKIYGTGFMRKHWSAFEIPVILDMQTKSSYRFLGKPLWGAIYFPFFEKTIIDLTNQL
ncbi:MAG: hypothetical protein DI598_05695 [Pseudopedobacter saltans]|uniref:Uncharacterized protein n=1 Tax=Pseudopedobacter saltans TaxID=151895 RepID=A0A2W5F2D7_9SPHI|nr:MAG: hypothetical protein DI598_05695 [Pseudopedobacter saltans]